jgi:hypothetical protein
MALGPSSEATASENPPTNVLMAVSLVKLVRWIGALATNVKRATGSGKPTLARIEHSVYRLL